MVILSGKILFIKYDSYFVKRNILFFQINYFLWLFCILRIFDCIVGRFGCEEFVFIHEFVLVRVLFCSFYSFNHPLNCAVVSHTLHYHHYNIQSSSSTFGPWPANTTSPPLSSTEERRTVAHLSTRSPSSFVTLARPILVPFFALFDI